MADSVTSGMELNSYQGNANLGTGEASGYAAPDISPLANYALKKYETSYRDFEQQQKDRTLLQEKFTDPNLFVQLDQEFGDQMTGKMNRFKDLGKMNLQMNPNSKEWYEFLGLQNEIIKDNATFKTVQTLKDNARKAADSTQDPHEKERLDGYVKQLSGYKLGDEVPVYNKYFAPVLEHLPQPDKIATKIKRVVGDKIQEVDYAANNLLDLDKKAIEQEALNPSVIETGMDLSHVLLENGGIDELNQKAKEAGLLSMQLNLTSLQDKYKSQLADFQKKNPGTGWQDFVAATPALSAEVNRINQGHQYAIKGVSYIPAETDGGRKLAGYTYFTSPEGKSVRLNEPDSVVRALFAATHEPVQSEKVLSESPAISPKDLMEDATKRRGQDMDLKAVRARIKADTDKWKSEQKGSETVKNGALEFAKNIYKQLEAMGDVKLVDGKIVISPDKVRQLNSEQLKYLGLLPTNTVTKEEYTDDAGVKRTRDVNNQVPILPAGSGLILDGNKVSVFENYQVDADGTPRGKFNNSLSTTLTNMATVRLTEENKNAGARELDTFLPIDTNNVENPISVNTSGGSSSQSSSTTTKKPVWAEIIFSSNGDKVPAEIFLCN